MCRKHEIIQRMEELAVDTKVLRESETSGSFIEGVVTPHAKSVAANAVETTKLKRELAALIRAENGM